MDSGFLDGAELFDLETLKAILNKRFDEIDYASAKEDVRSFIRDKASLDLWSAYFFQADDGAIGGTVTLVNKMDIHRKKTGFTRVFAPFWHFGTVTKNHETQIFSGFWWGANSCHRIFDPTDQEKVNHKQANEKFFRVQAARRMKGSHLPFLFLKIKKGGI